MYGFPRSLRFTVVLALVPALTLLCAPVMAWASAVPAPAPKPAAPARVVEARPVVGTHGMMHGSHVPAPALPAAPLPDDGHGDHCEGACLQHFFTADKAAPALSEPAAVSAVLPADVYAPALSARASSAVESPPHGPPLDASAELGVIRV